MVNIAGLEAFLGPVPEEIARPFGFSERQILVERLLQRRLREGEDPEAEICWGGPSDFGLVNTTPAQNGVSITISDEDEQPLEKEVLDFDEIERSETPLRVENPEDAEQFVEVMRIDDITFKGPDGICRKFILHHPTR